MTRKFTVKKEIRALGLDLCNPGRIVGAVVRGGLYLDGIVALPPTLLQSSAIANEILRTRFYPELKLIMTHDPKHRSNIGQIEKITRLPVLEIDTVQRTQAKGFATFQFGRRTLVAGSNLEPKTIREILSATWTTGALPEPLRIAHLVSKSRFHEKKCLI